MVFHQHACLRSSELSSLLFSRKAPAMIFFFLTTNICYSSCWVALHCWILICVPATGMCLRVCYNRPVIILADTSIVFIKSQAGWNTSEVLTHKILTLGEQELFCCAMLFPFCRCENWSRERLFAQSHVRVNGRVGLSTQAEKLHFAAFYKASPITLLKEKQTDSNSIWYPTLGLQLDFWPIWLGPWVCNCIP